MSAPASRVPVDVLLDADLGDIPRAVNEPTEAGADGLFTFEGPRDPFLPLAVAAAVPGSARLSPNLAIALPRSPLNLAQVAWDLQRASGGRLLLGLGTQVRRHVVERYGARWESPVDQLAEWLGAIRAIMAARQERLPLQFEGRWTRHTYMPPLFDPGGGRSPGAPVLHRAHPARAATAGRARAQVGFYASTPAYRVMLDVHGWGEPQPQLHALVRAGRWADLAAAVPDEVMAAFVCTGEPQEVADRLRRGSVGVDRLALSLFASPPARLELLDALR